MHTCIHTYIRTYVHTYIITHMIYPRTLAILKTAFSSKRLHEGLRALESQVHRKKTIFTRV